MSLQTKETHRPAARPCRPLEPPGVFRTLYERSPIGIAWFDNKGRFVRANKALQRMLGRSEKELQELTFNDITHADDLPACEALFSRLKRREIDHFEIEKRCLSKDGGVVWTQTAVTAACSGNRSCGTIGMAIDVTERHRAQEELDRLKTELEDRVKERTAELAYRGALLKAQQESAPVGVLVVDAEGRIVSHNKRFGELWGIPPSVLASGSDHQAVSSVLSKLVRPQDFVARIRYLYEHRDEKSWDQFELLDGRVFERYSNPVLGDDGHYYGRVWYIHDITDRALHERQLKEKSEELSRSNEELRMYAYAASHNLMSPLRRIISFGDLMMARLKGKIDAEDIANLERIQRSAAGAAKLVTDMLALSGIGREALPFEDVDLNKVLAEVKSELAPMIADARIEAGRLPVLRAHAPLLYSLLRNLISNGVKFRRADRPAHIRIDSRRDGEDVEISVADNGIGFDQAYAEKIFQPFYRLHTSNAYDGSGIGLAICRRIAQSYDGSLTTESEPGRGSIFTLRLPAAMLAR